MGRMSIVISGLLLIVMLAMFSGCGGSSPAGPIKSDNRDYGPPFNPVIFDDGEGYLATSISTALSSSPLFVRGIGSNETVSDLAYGYLVRPNSTEAAAEFAVYDREGEMLYVIDSDGSETATYFDGDEAFEGMFAFSTGGARLVYVRGTTAAQEIIIAGIKTSDFVSVKTLDDTQMFYGRPTVDITGDATRIAMMVDEGGTERILVYDRNGSVRASLDTPVQAIAYGPNGNHIAWVDASNQQELVIYDASLTVEEHRVNFSQFGNGASALAWSPDASMIAFFAGSNGATGRLCVYNRFQETLSEIIFDGTFEFPVGADRLWAAPSWNSSSDALVFTAMDGEGQYNVVSVDLIGNLLVLYEDVGGPRFVDFMQD